MGDTKQGEVIRADQGLKPEDGRCKLPELAKGGGHGEGHREGRAPEMTRVRDLGGGTGELESGEAGLGEEMEPLVGSSGQARKDKELESESYSRGRRGETEERNGAEREAACGRKTFSKLAGHPNGCDDRYR